MQNTSHAVMSQRVEPKSSFDDFPTPPWATRALLEHVLSSESMSKLSCLEPACGRGYMSRPLAEYFGQVTSFDIHPYGYSLVKDFLTGPYETTSFDWVITNPPFKHAEEFILHSLKIARFGVAILARTVLLESIGRYKRVFSTNPPTIFAQFSERVPIVKGRVDAKASTATGYGWFIWKKTSEKGPTELSWVPPCRRKLERPGDYD